MFFSYKASVSLAPKRSICLVYRSVEIQGQEIELTAKEFDILALLILNPRRAFTYEMISDIVWNEDYNE